MSASLPGSVQNLVDSDTLKWIFVGGKGGVGKTTTSCSLAVALAATRRSVLLVSTDPAHNLSDAFSQKFSNQPTLVKSFTNLYAMEVEPPQPSPTPTNPSATNADPANPANALAPGNVRDAANDMFGDIGGMLPGIDEAMAFGTLMKSVSELDHDVVIFDTAPTGHTMRLLGFPALLEKGLSVFRSLVDRFGPMANSVASTMGMQTGLDLNQMIQRIEAIRGTTREVSNIFADEAKCTFVCVCIPEFLSVFETERLVQEVAKFDINVTNIVVNQVIRDSDITDRQKGEKLYNARMAMQTKYLEQIIELYGEDFHITTMPLLSGEVRGKAALENYSKLILQEKKEFIKDIEGASELGEYEGSLKNVLDDKNLKWCFVGGKGGVGKTTTSSSIGVAFEKKGFKTLLVSTDPAHNLSDAFGQKISSGTEPTKINGYSSLFAMEVNATEAAENFLTKITASQVGSNNMGMEDGEEDDEANNILSELLPPDTLRQIISSIPGVDEAVSFMQIVKLARSMSFDRIVFDTAPTGHTLRLLEFPKVADKTLTKIDGLRQKIAPMLNMLAGSGAAPGMGNGERTMENLRKAEEEIENWKKGLVEVTNILNDQEKTTFVCVAIAEFLSVYETERLVQQLCELNVNVRNVLVNQLMTPEEKDVFGALKTRSKMQRKYLEQVDELYPPEDFHITYMPLLPKEVRGVDSLKEYGNLAVTGGADINK